MKLHNSFYAAAWFVALLLLPLTAAQAQTDDDDYRQEQSYRQNILKDNPSRVLKIHPFQVGEIYFGNERIRTGDVSNELGLSYIYQVYLKDGDDQFSRKNVRKTKGGGIRMEQRNYTSKDGTAPYGLFHGPMFGYRFVLFNESSYEIFGKEEPPAVFDPNARYIGRLFLNTFDLAYRLGYQYRLSKHFAIEVTGSLGARAKYGYAKGANELLKDLFVGKEITSQRNGVLLVTPLPQLKVALGYSFGKGAK